MDDSIVTRTVEVAERFRLSTLNRYDRTIMYERSTAAHQVGTIDLLLSEAF
jgi:hypothetical protein